ncbi:RDD family protein [Lentibacillus sp. CBA3610]|uniref:RDD family protein n=1 Tax=Lentibacillus sp. CBA3610 TaxID=2518176 RepID=UPI0015953800|nr:RDD family protein [Lentibacillus sp. CBA3610]QKY68453.1 RDD family protein [Lentibacillus sp. CBA3610]
MNEIPETYSETINDRRFAGFWMRFWAYLADLVIVFSINGILLSPFKFINDGDPTDIGFWTVTGIIGAIVFYLYFLLMTKYYGKTLGKMILGLRVVREDMEPLQWSDLIFREVVGRFIHRVFWFTNVLYLFVAFDTQKRGIHDMFAGTRVVFDR